ncbi:hypothetical protein [Microcoleus sp. PH2017_08_TRC_O_A]|uniref:hypothetical protein n=1 Tax=Microcoleus sp. PH2017_08_TRC_O_A TaxID=2798819 RepID=UPI001D56931F|nr:hypothetical protein [Microcoleus sp. PH2017_08_TRC_O_A]MCC3454913.1 hypothetical protein [Microcoleus sp. PH2017_08_TRC_O_A]
MAIGTGAIALSPYLKAITRFSFIFSVIRRRKKEEGRRRKKKEEEGRRKKEEGRRKKEEGRRKKEEGRRKKEEKKEEGRRKKEEGRMLIEFAFELSVFDVELGGFTYFIANIKKYRGSAWRETRFLRVLLSPHGKSTKKPGLWSLGASANQISNSNRDRIIISF